MTEGSGARQTPGVYVTEIDALGSAIVGVATAVPIFIGYTQFAGDPVAGRSLYNTPVEIASMANFATYFGSAATGGEFSLCRQMELFFANGGCTCYVVSVGSYWAGRLPTAAVQPIPGTWVPATMTADDLTGGIAAAGSCVGPTMTLVPEACGLDQEAYSKVACAMLQQASSLQDRMAILDLPGCLTADSLAALQACQSNFWAAIAPQSASLSYAAAYAPALVLADDQTVVAPSGLLAGIWTSGDTQAGVWNAPANIALAGVARPLVAVDDAQQGGFNVPLNGMAINLIRSFTGQGTLVWGARTLDGNSDDYRYIQVRRTLIYIEQSIKLALQNYVFAANDATTWVTVTTAISSFLNGLWQAGGLVGAKPSDAFTVQCGLGSTMTNQNIFDGYMIVAVTVAVVHPAEFIELTFTQTMGS